MPVVEELAVLRIISLVLVNYSCDSCGHKMKPSVPRLQSSCGGEVRTWTQKCLLGWARLGRHEMIVSMYAI